MSGFVTRVDQEKEEPFTVIFTTDDHSKYIHIETECRKMIDHAKPTTNADRIREMTDEEIEDWYWWMHKEMMYYTDSRAFVHDWLKEGVDDATND